MRWSVDERERERNQDWSRQNGTTKKLFTSPPPQLITNLIENVLKSEIEHESEPNDTYKSGWINHEKNHLNLHRLLRRHVFGMKRGWETLSTKNGYRKENEGKKIIVVRR